MNNTEEVDTKEAPLPPGAMRKTLSGRKRTLANLSVIFATKKFTMLKTVLNFKKTS